MRFRRTAARQAGRPHLVYGATIIMVAVALLTSGCGIGEQAANGLSVLETESTVTTIATATSTTLSMHETIQQEQAAATQTGTVDSATMLSEGTETKMTDSTTSEETKPSSGHSARWGESCDVEGLRITVAKPERKPVKIDGEGVVAAVIFENVGSEQVYYGAELLLLSGTDGFQYESHLIYGYEPLLGCGYLQPGLKKQGYVTFDAPPDGVGISKIMVQSPSRLDSTVLEWHD
jgi:hypothetical protein